MKLGFIGTGVMGTSIIKHLLLKGHDVTVYNRTKEKAQPVLNEGAVWADTPKQVSEQSHIIFTMVGYPTDVEMIYYGDNGIFEDSITNKIIIDLTTSTPSLAKKIAQTAKEKGASALDAPVSGGDVGAKNGTLTTMVGGDMSTYEQVESLLYTFSSKVKRQGDSGAGQHTKMANQIMIAGTMLGMCELLVYAKHAGLNLQDVIDTVGAGSAQNWSLSNYGPRILNDDFEPGFYAKHLLKDLKIALDEAKVMGINLSGLETAKIVYERLVELGYGNLGTQSLVKLYDF